MDDNNSWEIPTHEKHEFLPRENTYCICVFVINEGEKLIKQLQSMKPFRDEIDIVIADGGSTDGSTEHERLKSLGVNTLLVKKDKGGLGSQMRMAFAWALSRQYEGVVVIDGNGKDSVESIPDFIRSLGDGYDHVQGSRFIEGGVSENLPFARWLGVKLLHVPLMRLASGFKYTDTTNGFRAYSAKLLGDTSISVFRSEFTGYELHYHLAKEAARRQYRLVEIPVERRYPSKGAVPTKISPIRGNANVVQKLVSVCLGKYDSDRSEALPISSTGSGRRFPLSAILLSMMMFAVTLFVWCDWRFSMNPDGMAYMDIALEYANGHWSNAVNSSWPPLYSWLLVPVMKANLSPAHLFPAVNFVNVMVMAVTLFAFHLMLGEMILLKNSISKNPLNDLTFRLIAYGLLFASVIQTRVVLLNTPDLLQYTFLFIIFAHLIRL